MTAVVTPLRLPDDGSLLAKLLGAVRPEFQAESIRIDPDDPVFARGRCSAQGCDRGAWSRLLCAAHYNRWRLGGRPEMAEFCATTEPIISRAGSALVDAFDLSGLNLQPRLETAYSIQCRAGRVRRLPAPPRRHPRHTAGLRPRRARRRRRMGQTQPRAGRGVAAQRLLRPAAAAELPAPQRLPDLPRLPDHAAVSAAAKTSRSLLYRDADIRAEIQRLRALEPSGTSRLPAAQRTSDISLQQRLTTLLDDNRSLRDENRKLQDRIAALLGEQRAASTPTSRPRARTIGPCS